MPCICCQEKINRVDYKEVRILRKFVTSQFSLKNHKKTGLCKKHQRKVSQAVKNARFMALMPHVRSQTRQSQSQQIPGEN